MGRDEVKEETEDESAREQYWTAMKKGVKRLCYREEEEEGEIEGCQEDQVKREEDCCLYIPGGTGKRRKIKDGGKRGKEVDLDTTEQHRRQKKERKMMNQRWEAQT